MNSHLQHATVQSRVDDLRRDADSRRAVGDQAALRRASVGTSRIALPTLREDGHLCREPSRKLF